MAHAAVDHLRVARCRPVTPAVAWRAEKGPALHNLARNADRGLGGIVAAFDRGAAAAAAFHRALHLDPRMEPEEFARLLPRSPARTHDASVPDLGVLP